MKTWIGCCERDAACGNRLQAEEIFAFWRVELQTGARKNCIVYGTEGLHTRGVAWPSDESVTIPALKTMVQIK